MPTFTGTTFASFYKRILQINQSGNTAPDSTTRNVQGGDGTSTAISLSDDVLGVQPINDNSVATFKVETKGGSDILAVDTTNSKVKVGPSQVNATTQYKEMGLYDFSPSQGYHHPLIAHTMFVPSLATAFAAETDWGNGPDPATTLDVSALGQRNAIAVYWYITEDITIDVIRYLINSDGTSDLSLHLMSYTLDIGSNFGDLAAGTLNAHVHSVEATVNTIKTGTLTKDAADIDSGKIVIGFVENESGASDVSVALTIQYHIR